MYELINQSEADRIKEILETSMLIKPINIDVMENDFKLRAYSVSTTNPSENHPEYEAQEFYLLDKNNTTDVLQCNNRFYNVYMNVGEWGYNGNSRLDKAHITLGSSKFHKFCLQIELSHAFKDDEYIYIVKNVKRLGATGAIARLYRGLKNDSNSKEKKLKRQETFKQRFGGQILNYKNSDWICISKIKIQDLYNDDESEKIFYELAHNMFFAMLLVESIGQGTVKESIHMAEEIPKAQQSTLKEGAKTTVVVNAYERNPMARSQCIKYYKTLNDGKIFCQICGFNFGEFYGKDFEGKINVHHITPLNKVDGEYEVNPQEDLLPVCPNCHLAIHSKEPPYTPDQIKEIINNR